jgi:hypothetical protein
MTNDNVQTPIPAAEAAEIVDPAAILRELLDTVRELKANREEDLSRFSAEKAELEERLSDAEATANAAKRTAELNDEAGSMTPDVSPVALHADHPERDVEKKLDIMARQAKENGADFDRDRTRKVLLHQPVNDINKFVFMGHAFEDEIAMDVYKDKVRRELEATAGKYPRS